MPVSITPVPASGGRLLDSQRSTQGAILIPSTATTAATSLEVPGLSVGWTHGNAAVEVTFIGTLRWVGVSQAAGLVTAVRPYISDASAAGVGGTFDLWNAAEIAFQFPSANATRFLQVPFIARTEITATPGSFQMFSARAIIAVGAAASWQCHLLGFPNPLLIQAREIL